jgi:hypothetical protein
VKVLRGKQPLSIHGKVATTSSREPLSQHRKRVVLAFLFAHAVLFEEKEW